ncbi:MAG: response regulator [bacterium]
MKNILLVEDEKILTDMYKEKLVHSGFKVISVSSAEEGLDIIAKSKIDLVILDILLPKENGLYFLEKQKSIPEISSVPVIVFSNYNDTEFQAKAKEFGAEAYLLKTSVTPSELIDKINQYLAK